MEFLRVDEEFWGSSAGLERENSQHVTAKSSSQLEIELNKHRRVIKFIILTFWGKSPRMKPEKFVKSKVKKKKKSRSLKSHLYGV
jgi:hypothetical protein